MNRTADLFAGAHAPIHFVDESAANHIEQNNPRAGVQDLLACRAIALILHIRSCRGTLSVYTNT